jgi:beta-galactosidase
VLTIGEEVRDRAWVLLDGVPVGVMSRDAHERSVVLPETRGELVILVEDQGRVDYGVRLGEHKGLIGGVALDGVEVSDWSVRLVDLDRVPELASHERSVAFAAGPTLARGEFELDEAADLFLDTLDWGKGLVWVNGFLLGRYWRRGPQRTLIVPGPVTRAGRNELVLLEFEAIADPVIRFVAGPELGHTEI